MSTPRHQDEPGARRSDAALPPLRLAKLVHPGVALVELVGQRAPATVLDVRPARKGLA